MPLSPKTRLGTYEIVGPLGAGGMGEVYRAKDLRLGRDVAVKVLPEAVGSSPDRLARFEREARTVAGLNHPNIVTLFSVEDESGLRFLTMELVEGQTLSDLIVPGGFPLSRILALSIPLADALVAAHERGVIHRDLKPGNIMVTRDGRVKVLDFGLARITGTKGVPEGSTLSTTATSPPSDAGQVLGTVPYMAPEQLRGETADGRSDLFALGIILYELAAGRRPFAGRNPVEVGSAILRDTPEPLARVRPDLPGDIERIVGRCLEKNPRERFQTALDVSNELRRLRKILDRGEPEKAPSDGVATIAVLPFVNRSASADDEYFSDGLADELLGVLSKIHGLRVSARASSFHFKGKDVPLSEIGHALNVATVLDGSVRKAGNRIRVSVQLVKVSDGYHLWSDTYDRTLDDIFAVQDDIAQSVVKELRKTLLGSVADSDASGQVKSEVAAAAKGRTTNPEAHRLFLLARHLVDRWTREDTAKGIQYLKEALALDPGFALAWVELGRAHSNEAANFWTPVAEGYGRSMEAGERALRLEPDLAEAHGLLAWIRLFHRWDWRGADTAIRRALELEPGNAQVLRRAAVVATAQGRFTEGIDLNLRALEQDPLSGSTYHFLGEALAAADRPAEAERAYRKALELAPHRIMTHSSLALTLLAQDRGEEALAEAMQEPEERTRLMAIGIIRHARGPAEPDEALQDLLQNHAGELAYEIALVYAARGERDAAFQWLERAHAQRDSGLPMTKANPMFRSLHGDPRWGPFLRKMGLEG